MTQLEMDKLQQLQRENLEWQERNFPDQTAHQALLGVVEEAGELAEALGADPPYAEFFDAVADTAIFLTNYASKHGWDLGTMWAWRHAAEMPPRPLPILIGRLCRCQLKIEQGIRGSADEHKQRGYEAACALLAHLEHLCALMGRSFVEVVMQTWDEVRLRDWQANKLDGTGVSR